MRSLILKAVDAHIAEVMPGIIDKAFDELLPAAVMRAMKETLATKPNHELTPVGFGWAVFFAFQKRWPNVSHRQANAWIRDYVEVPYGTKGHEWTSAAADEIVALYVADLGETS